MYREIALIGTLPKPERDANEVMRYLLEHAYEVQFPHTASL